MISCHSYVSLGRGWLSDDGLVQVGLSKRISVHAVTHTTGTKDKGRE